MSGRYKYTTMDRVFSKIDRDLSSDFNEDDIIERTGEALEQIGSVKSYQEAVCFIKVTNHQCLMPKWLHAIIQIARDNQSGIDCETEFTVFTHNVKETFQDTLVLTDNGEIVSVHEDVEVAKNNINMTINYKGWVESGYYLQRFTPVRLAESSFFQSLVCEETRSIPYMKHEANEYKIIDGEVLRFSFKEGIVAVAYLKQSVDTKTGWPLIPDTASHLEAIYWYNAKKMAEKDLHNGRQGAMEWFKTCGENWNWYCKQAANIDMMPYGIDEHQNLLDQRSYLLPKDKYYGFFGNLAHKENRKFNNPNNRRRYY